MSHLPTRRLAHRISVDGLCGVIANDELRPASLRDLSEHGLRLERPFDPRATRGAGQRSLQLELELPGVDEVLWVRAVVSFAILTPLPGRTADGQPRFWCRAGLRLADICRAERQLLRDYVHDTRQAAAAS